MLSQVTTLSPFENHLSKEMGSTYFLLCVPLEPLPYQLGVLLVVSKNSRNSYLSKEDISLFPIITSVKEEDSRF